MDDQRYALLNTASRFRGGDGIPGRLRERHSVALVRRLTP
jgi:hypothetical protein